VFILNGKATLCGESGTESLRPGDTAQMLPNEKHRFINKSTELLRFLSVIPPQGKRIGLMAQVSVYPLRQKSLSPAINASLRVLRKHDLEVHAGSMSTMIAGDSAVVFQALQQAYEETAQQGEVVLIATFSNACPAPEDRAE
jgi:uncharacterized protein YqgV (UPF0045/DUF77 family)